MTRWLVVALSPFALSAAIAGCGSDNSAISLPTLDASMNGTGGYGGSASSNGGSQTATGGSAATCNPAYCPPSGVGTPCCLTATTCGTNYGMGCVKTGSTDGG